MKKTWIKLKRGLLEPKHRLALGPRIWLYFHILDRANWKQGTVLEWKDKGEAESLEMDINTLRKQRQRLEKDGYITCKKQQHSLKITVHKWVNPREYSGKVYNQSGKQRPLSEEKKTKAKIQSGNESGNQSSNELIDERTTLPIDSHNHKSQDKEIKELEYIDAGKEFDEPKQKKKLKGEHKAMVKALSEVCEVDANIKSNWSWLGKTAKELVAAGRTPVEVIEKFGVDGPWYKKDWRGQKGQKPSPAVVLQSIAQLSAKKDYVSGPFAEFIEH